MTLSAKPTKRSDPSLRPLNSHSTSHSCRIIHYSSIWLSCARHTPERRCRRVELLYMRNTCSQKVLLYCVLTIVLVELEVTLKTDTGGAGLKTCSHGYSTVRFLVRCSMVCTAASNQKPHTCKSAMLPTVNPRHRSGVARGRAPSRWPLVRTARPSRCLRPTCNTSTRGCPPRRHTRRHLAPSSMGPGRTSTQKRVTFGGELA